MNKATKFIFLNSISSVIFTLPAMSYSPFLDQSMDMYSVRNKCEMCHSGMKLNSFGKDFGLEWNKHNKDIVKAFLELEKKDSDGDGFINIDEIKSMSLPGDKVSTPQIKNTYNNPDLFRKVEEVIK